MSAPEKLGSEYYRGFLSKQGQVFYDRIYTRLLRGDYTGRISFSLPDPTNASADCFAAYKAIKDDHPEFFFLGYECKFSYSGRIGTFCYSVLYSTEIIKRIQYQLRKKIYQIVRGTLELDLIEQELLVYERIAKTITYTNNEDVRDHNVVGPVLLSEGVCEGQNALLMLCFRRLGIPCIKVSGQTETDEDHCWTIAWIGDTPVHCDVTWDGQSDGIVMFDYFNLSDCQISKDHHNYQTHQIPACPDDRFNYYRQHNLCVDSYSTLQKCLKGGLFKGRYPIRIHFDYQPHLATCLEDVKKAISRLNLTEEYKIILHPKTKNIAIKKL